MYILTDDQLTYLPTYLYYMDPKDRRKMGMGMERGGEAGGGKWIKKIKRLAGSNLSIYLPI